MTGLLSTVIWLPILAGVAVLLTGSDRHANYARWLALGGAVAGFIVALPLYIGFDADASGMQFVELVSWIESYNVNYHLGIDGISLLLILMNTFTTVLVVLAGWQVIDRWVAQYMAALLILSGMMNGVFCALDAALFYAFFESTLIPMFIIIGVWGGPNRVYAALKFFLYTLLGSLLTLVALVYLYTVSGGSFALLDYYRLQIPMTAQILLFIIIGVWGGPNRVYAALKFFLYTLLGSLLTLVAFVYLYTVSGGSFALLDYYRLQIPMTAQILLFIAFFAAFAVKVPMFPVHTWLPDAHVEAPTGGSVVLAAVMLKLGAYGFIRLSLPILPDASRVLAPIVIGLSLIAVVYIGLVALVQTDMKKLIAYSSISHMGFVTLGIFLFSPLGMEGAVMQMVSHGFVSGALFLCVGVLYDRMHTRLIADYGGVVNKMPVFAAFFMLFAMANSGLPGTSGFVGEFLVVLGAMHANFWYAAIAATTLLFGAAYTLWMYKRVVFGAIANSQVNLLVDVKAREGLVLALVAIAVLGMGLYPQAFAGVLHNSVNELLAIALRSKI